MNNNTKGILWMISTVFFSAIAATLMRLLAEDDFHPFQITFMSNLGALLFMSPWIIKLSKTKTLETIYTRGFRLYTSRSIFEFAGFSLIAFATTMIPLPILTSIQFTAPLMTIALAGYFLGEKSNIHTWLSMALGFGGVLIIVRPGFIEFNIGVLLVLIAAFCFATCGVLLKKLCNTEPPRSVAFYMFLITGTIALPFAAIYWKNPDLEHLFLFLALGGAFYMLQYSVSHSFANADVTVILPFSLLNLVFISFSAYYIFGELIDIWTILGSIIILGAAIYGVKKRAKH